MNEGLHVLSIWHTGTRSVLEFYGLPQLSAHYTHLRPEFDGMQAKRSASIYPCVVMPLRDPREVWRSWERRSYRKWGRPNGGTNTVDWFRKAWRMAHEIATANDVMVLPVDHDKRELYINAISNKWPHLIPVASAFPHVRDNDKAPEYDDTGVDFESIYALVESMGVCYHERAAPLARDNKACQ